MACPKFISYHVGTNPIITSERHAQHSQLTMWEHIPRTCQKGPTLTFDHERNQPSHLCQKGPALIFDHARNQSYLHVERALHLHLIMRRTNPACQKGSALISDHVGTNPIVTSEWPYTYIWSCRNQSYSHIRMALSPRPSIPGNWSGTSIQRMAIVLISDHVGTNSTVISEWLNTHILLVFL